MFISLLCRCLVKYVDPCPDLGHEVSILVNAVDINDVLGYFILFAAELKGEHRDILIRIQLRL